MTGEQLKDELARVAEGAPEIHVPDDLFARGRRATTRARVLAGASAVACLVIVAAIAVPLLRSDSADFADGDAGSTAGVPDAIYGRNDGSRPDLPVASKKGLGPVAASYVSFALEPQLVVVRTDGSYRLIDVKGLSDPAFDPASPKLSPDGLRIAYAARTGDRPGIMIADLVSGKTVQVGAEAPLGMAVRSLQWTPDGEWLAWSAQAVRSRSGNSASFRQRIIGGVTDRGGTTRMLPTIANGWDGLGICNDGTALRYVWPTFLATPPSGGVERVRSWQRLVEAHGTCTPPLSYAHSDALSADELIGWVPTDEEAHAVLLTKGVDNDYLLLATDGEVERIGEVAPALDGLTIATGLMTPDRPTVPAGEDPWQGSWWERHRDDVFIAAVLIAAPCLLLLFVRRRLRR